jgi:hypothetical protein
MPVSEETVRRLRRNLLRVEDIVGLAGMMQHQAEDPERAADLLRAAAVLLHATLDDFLRTVAKERWQSFSNEWLKPVPLPGRKPGEKITFVDLFHLRGKSVDDLVRDSVLAYLDGRSFNNWPQIDDLLHELHVSSPGPQANDLKELMQRRHHIVHQADKADGPSGHAEQAIDEASLDRWVRAVQHVSAHVIKELA